MTYYDTRKHDPKVGECVGLTVQECTWICAVAMRACSKERLSVRGSSADRACRTLGEVQLRQGTDPCGVLLPVVRGSSAECHQ